jgi:hypothetical protein
MLSVRSSRNLSGSRIFRSNCSVVGALSYGIGFPGQAWLGWQAGRPRLFPVYPGTEKQWGAAHDRACLNPKRRTVEVSLPLAINVISGSISPKSGCVHVRRRRLMDSLRGAEDFHLHSPFSQ